MIPCLPCHSHFFRKFFFSLRGQLISSDRPWAGLILTSTLSFLVIVISYYSSIAYYNKYMPQGDGIWYFQQLGQIYYFSRQYGFFRTLQNLLESQSLTILTPLMGALLAPWLPLSWQWAVVCNGIWYFLFCLSVFVFFFERTKDWKLSCILLIPLMAWLPPVGETSEGITDLHCNHLGYTLGGCSLFFLLSSNILRRLHITVLSSLCLGLLMLGRWFSACLILWMSIPILWRAAKGDTRSRRGLLLFFLVFILSCGWWALPRLGAMLAYPVAYYGKGILGSLSILDTLKALNQFIKKFLGYNTAFMVFFSILSWTLGYYLLQSEKNIQKINYKYLWMAISPLFFAMILRSFRYQYIWPSIFGIYLFFLYPVIQSEDEHPLFSRRIPRLLLCLASMIAYVCFLHAIWTYHRYPYPTIHKENVSKVIESILIDAINRGKDSIDLDVFHHGVMTFGRIADWFMFEWGCPVEDQAYPPRLQAIDAKHPVIRCPMRFFQWPRKAPPPLGSSEISSLISELIVKNDYLIVLVSDESEKSFPEARILSDLLRSHAGLRSLTPPLSVSDEETVIVLTKHWP